MDTTIPPAIDTWLTRFAAGAGTLLVWEMMPGNVLRARIEEDTRGLDRFCPLTAEWMIEYGRAEFVGAAMTLGQRQGLREYEADMLIGAADALWQYSGTHPTRYGATCAAIRRRLLHICHLEEDN